MRGAVILALAAVAACSTPAYPPTPTPSAAPPAAASTPAAPTRPATPAPPTDACGASKLQNLVGRSRFDIPAPVRPELQRVACTTCPVTMDYNPERLNIFFDASTGIIKEVRCG